MHLVTPRLNIRPYEEVTRQTFTRSSPDPVVMRDCEPPYDWKPAQGGSSAPRDPIAYAVALKDSRKMIGHALFKQLPGRSGHL